jgi:hypothetical protein
MMLPAGNEDLYCNCGTRLRWMSLLRKDLRPEGRAPASPNIDFDRRRARTTSPVRLDGEKPFCLEASHPWRSGVRPGITCDAEVVRTAAARQEPRPTDVTVIHWVGDKTTDEVKSCYLEDGTIFAAARWTVDG